MAWATCLPPSILGLVLAAACTSAFADQATTRKIDAEMFARNTCRVIEDEASRHALPASFFARLIWRESLFNPAAVSRKGAQGIAQFMPGTAAEYGLTDPFDTAPALAASARYLQDLRAQFDSLGLAAAAYNACPARVGTWLNGKSELPFETQDYVLWITGHSVEDWSKADAPLALLPIADNLTFAAACRKLAARGLTAKLPSRTLRSSGWQTLFASGLGITQVKASQPGRVRVVIDVGRSGAKTGTKLKSRRR